MSGDDWRESQAPLDGSDWATPEDDAISLIGDEATWHRSTADEACRLIASVPEVMLDRRNNLILVDDRLGGTPKIVPVDSSMVPDLLGRANVVVRQPLAKGGTRPVAVPGVLCQTVVSRRTKSAPWQSFEGFASGPYLLNTGEIVQTHGFAPARGLWLPHVGVCPLRSTGAGAVLDKGFDRTQARKVLDWILKELEEFPWADSKLDPAVWLGYVMTLITRPAYDSSPLFLFEASRPRSGKDLLLKCAEIVAHGRQAGRVTLIDNNDENEKRIGMMLLDGHTTIIFGDVKQLGSPLILSIITEGPEVGVRALGGLQRIPVPKTLTLGATANNISLPTSDLLPRTISLRLDPPTDRPELTPHSRDQDALLKWFRTHRSAILAGLFNVLRGYIHRTPDPELDPHGMPCGSFPAWARMVRDPLLWCDLPDLLETQDRLRAQTPVADDAALDALIAAWWDCVQQQEMTAGRLLQLASTADRIDGDGQAYTDRNAERLAFALKELDDRLTAKGLGKRLAAARDRVVTLAHGRVKLQQKPAHGQNVYTLIRIGG